MKRLGATFVLAIASISVGGCSGASEIDATGEETVGATAQPLTGSGHIEGFGGKCLAAFGYDNGTEAVLWDCLNLSSEMWRLFNDGTIRSADGLCLSTNGNGTDNGTRLILWTCLGQANQRWSSRGNGLLTGQAGKVVSTIGYTSANGTKIGLWDNLNQANQQWTLPVDEPPPPPPPPRCHKIPMPPDC
jgi:hypothetical protein